MESVRGVLVPAGSVWAIDRAHGHLCTSVAVTLLPSVAWFDGQGLVSCCGLPSGQPVNASGCIALAGRAMLGSCTGGEVSYSVARVEPGVAMLLLAACLALASIATVCAAATAQLLSPLTRRAPSAKAVATFSLSLGMVLCWSLFHFGSALGPWIALVVLACCVAGAWPSLVALRIVRRPLVALCVFGWCAGLHVAQLVGASVSGLFVASAVAIGVTQMIAVGLIIDREPLWFIAAAEAVVGIALFVKVNMALWSPHSSALYRFFAALAFEHVLLLLLLAPRVLRSFRKPPPVAPAAS